MALVDIQAAIGEWAAWAWRAGLASLAALAVLLIAKPLIRRRVSAHTASWLWLVPLVPLALPFAPGLVRPPMPAAPAFVTVGAEVRTSAGPHAPSPSVREDVRSTVDVPGDPSRVGATDSAAPERAPFPVGATASVARGSVAPDEPEGDALSLARALGLAWFVVAVALLAVTLLRIVRTHRVVRRAKPCEDVALRRRFALLVREQRAPRTTRLLLAPDLASPATAGLLRPAVLVSPEVLAELAPQELEFALRHELAHARRRDVLVDALVRVVRAVWFFHPSVWIAPLHAARARELACDEAAVARGSDALGAARALLHVIEHGRRRPALGAGSVPLTHPRSLEEERVMQLMKPTRPALRGLSPFAAVAVLAAAAFSLPGAPNESAPDVLRYDAFEPTAPPTVAEVAPPQERARTSESVLTGALTWLVAQQQEDGGWRASTRAHVEWAGELDDVGTTASVLLALEGAPKDAAIAGRKDAMLRGLRYLAAHQEKETGCFTSTSRNMVAVPSHALALRAWIELNAAHAGEFALDWRPAATAGVAFAESARNPYLGWRYSVVPSGDNDTVITGWMLDALASARRNGLEVDDAAFDGGAAILEEVFDPTTGRYGYSAKGQPTSRLATKAEDFPGDLVEFPTAVAMCAELALGASPMESDELLASATLLATKLPDWSRGKGTIDSYYWAFGTRAMQPMGGVLTARWNAAVERALVEHAESDDEGRAWWVAVDAWHDEGSEVGMTAMCALALEAAHRERLDR
ncbi:MAG: M56 family metallopeptidase [Planctomycetota bacterium]